MKQASRIQPAVSFLLILLSVHSTAAAFSLHRCSPQRHRILEQSCMIRPLVRSTPASRIFRWQRFFSPADEPQVRPSVLVLNQKRQSSYMSKSSINSSLLPWLDEMETDDASLAHLQQRIQAFVAKSGENCRLSLAMAGGGGNFLGLLASTPGASRILLQGSVLYDRESYRRFVQRTLDRENFRYASVESSEFAADAALDQALILSAAGKFYRLWPKRWRKQH